MMCPAGKTEGYGNEAIREIAEKGVFQLRTGGEISEKEAKALLGE